MSTLSPLPLSGCRHDVLGHALKAIGLLRAISQCALPEDCDPSAEGWWNPDSASFLIRSARYPDADCLVKFFAEKYRPTPIIAAWNKSGGVTDNIEVTISGSEQDITRFRIQNDESLNGLGLKKSKKLSKAGDLKFSTVSSNRIEVEGLLAKFNAVPSQTSDAQGVDVDTEQLSTATLSVKIIAKESGKKDGVLPSAARLLSSDQAFQKCLELARQYVTDLQGIGDSDSESEDVFLRYRDQLPDAVAESFDSLCALHITQQNDNPLFVRRGRPGDKVNADIFLNFWDYFIGYRKNPKAFADASLFGSRVVGSGIPAGDQKGKGTPFFPDAIKSYNQGIDWVTEDFPFCPLDYLLAVEGALAMRGAMSKTLSARSRSRAAFPFVFEGTDTMTDEQGKSLRLASSFWLPIWIRPTTFAELQSFILDCQARLPAKDCRFSSDFARAIRSQGVDAGFFAFQEFQFKLKGANVPWSTVGRFVVCSGVATTNVLNELLAPVDASGFLNQFEFNRERKSDLHPLRAPVLDAIEAAAAEPDAPKILDVLSHLATLNAQLARSKSLREKVGAGRVTFVPPLQCDEWSVALRDIEDDPEFVIARALASIRGHEKQQDGKYSELEPFLGSLVPLRRKQGDWYLPDPPSAQSVWTGIDLVRDLSAILARRILDSAKDARPAIVGSCTARLSTVLQFLRGELDDRRIATLVEAVSLIDWRYAPRGRDAHAIDPAVDERLDPVPVAYAAVRSLLEIACETRSLDGNETTDRTSPHVVVQRTISLVSHQERGMVAAATTEALRRLAVVGIPNPYGEKSRREKPKLAGRDVIQVGGRLSLDEQLSRRLAAAVLIPLDWRDRWKLFRAITLPQTT